MTAKCSRSVTIIGLAVVAACALLGAEGRPEALAQAGNDVPPKGKIKPLVKLELKLDRPTCLLGDAVTLTATLTGLDPLGPDGESFIQLAFDHQSISFELHDPAAGQAATRFHYLRHHDSVYPQEKRSYEDFHLTPGSSVSLETPMLAVKTGRLSIRAIYDGIPRDRDAPPTYSEPVTLEVTPRDGKSDLCVRMETTSGTVVTRLWPADALGTVINFATLVRQKTYDGLIFHRVIGPAKAPPAGFMIQGGCPKHDGSAGPGWTIPEEFNDRKHQAGVISMARSRHPNSAGSQFFICLAPIPRLDGHYTAFGETIEGLDVVETIGAVETDDSDRPTTPVRIESARLEYR